MKVLSTRRVLGLGAVAGVALTLGTGALNPAHAATTCVPVLGAHVCVDNWSGTDSAFVSASVVDDSGYVAVVGGELFCDFDEHRTWRLYVGSILDGEQHDHSIDTGLAC